MGSLKNIKTAILNGNLFINNKFKKGSILIENDRIKKVFYDEIPIDKLKGYEVIDAHDCYVSYGFFDPHVHFRTPGYEHKEDWQSGSKAAIKGGYTYVVDMPNTNPPGVDIESLNIKDKIAENAIINYGFHIGLTDNNYDKIKSYITSLNKHNKKVLGIKVFLGSSTGDLLVKKKKSIKKSLKTKYINLFHCEDEKVLKEFDDIKYDSVYDHERKRPVSACISGIKKIIKSASKKSHIYICHVSSKAETGIIKKYRKKGYNIIAEITPHHLFYYSQKIIDNNIFKVNPPIRSMDDALYLRKKFNKGFFQIIGTDHAPHLLKEKESDNPPSGMPGLESAFYALYYLHENNSLSLKMIFNLLTNGYKLFKIKNRGKISKNNYADITIIKKTKNIFKSEESFTKSDFSPFDGLETNCKVDTVLINGKIVLNNGKFIN